MADFQEKHMHTDVGFTHWSLDNALQLWQWKSSPLFSLWSFLRWYVFERQSYKGRETEIFHLFLYSLNDHSDWGQARQSQELHPYLLCACRAQIHEPSSIAFPGISIRSWTRSEGPGLKSVVLDDDNQHHRWQQNCNTAGSDSSFNFIVLKTSG